MQRAVVIEEMGKWARKVLRLLCTPFKDTFKNAQKSSILKHTMEKSQTFENTQWKKNEHISDKMQRVVVIKEMGRWVRKELGPETHHMILSSSCTNYTEEEKSCQIFS